MLYGCLGGWSDVDSNGRLEQEQEEKKHKSALTN